MNIPRYWRTERTRYALIGETCRACGEAIFPPRDVCPHCTETGQDVHPFVVRGRCTPFPPSTMPRKATQNTNPTP